MFYFQKLLEYMSLLVAWMNSIAVKSKILVHPFCVNLSRLINILLSIFVSNSQQYYPVHLKDNVDLVWSVLATHTEERDMRKLLEVIDMSISLIIALVHECLYMSKLIRLYTLNMCSVFYINYTSIELFLFKKVCLFLYLWGISVYGNFLVISLSGLGIMVMMTLHNELEHISFWNSSCRVSIIPSLHHVGWNFTSEIILGYSLLFWKVLL